MRASNERAPVGFGDFGGLGFGDLVLEVETMLAREREEPGREEVEVAEKGRSRRELVEWAGEGYAEWMCSVRWILCVAELGAVSGA